MAARGRPLAIDCGGRAAQQPEQGQAENRPALAALADREQAIVRARYGLDGDERRLSALGETLGISAERVRQLECGALGKLAATAGGDWAS